MADPMQGPNIIPVERAARYVVSTCQDTPRAFFFLIGAGASHPPVPLATDIVAECRRRVSLHPAASELSVEPSDISPMDRYSWWFREAFPSASGRQRYLRSLIEGKSISQANLRLAHLLLSRRLTNLVVTPNFDDFLSRALVLFGEQPIVCDHPETIPKIDLQGDDLQVVHLHGAYWFYDCANLAGEIQERARRPADSPFSMRAFLDHLLTSRSPLVVGYSGWEQDVFMEALAYRLQRRLGQNVYWFCYRRDEVAWVPEWLRRHPDVFFVCPPEVRPAGETPLQTATGNAMRKSGEGTLPAREVFETLIRAFGLEAPPLVKEPFRFFRDYFERAAPRDDEGHVDIYFRDILERFARTIEAAVSVAADAAPAADPLEPVRAALRIAQHREAIQAARDLDGLEPAESRELIEAMRAAAGALLDDSPDEIQAYEVIERTAQWLIYAAGQDPGVELAWAQALLYRAITLGNLHRNEEAVAAYDALLARFGEAEEPAVREQVAMAFRNKGVRLWALGRSEEAVATYDAMLARFGEATEPGVRQQVAVAFVNKGYTLETLGRSEEAIATYDALLARFGEGAESGIREQVAVALRNKGVRLGALNRGEAAVAVYDALLARFGEAAEPGIREQVAAAFVNKGYTLGTLGRSEEAVATYDAMLARFGEATEPGVRQQAAMAFVNKGYTLGTLGRIEEEVAVYDAMLARFREAEEPGIREQVAMAFQNKGVRLGALNRGEEAVAVYDAMLARFGEAAEPGVRQQVATAFVNKGYTLGALGRIEEEVAVYDAMLARFGEGAEPGIREQVAMALRNKGVRLWELNRGEEAVAVYDALLARFEDAEEPGIREQVAMAFVNKGYTLGTLGRSEEEAAVYDAMLARFEDAEEPGIREQVAMALRNKGVTPSSPEA